MISDIKGKISILVDGRWFDSYYSGVTTHLKGLYNALARNPMFSITVVGWDMEKLKNDFPDNVNFLELRTHSNIKRLFFDVPAIIKKNKFDFAHFQYVCPFTKKCKYIVTLHDLLFLDYKKSFPLTFIIKNTFLFYLSAKRADILITVSEYSKKSIINHFRIKEKKLHVLPNGVLEKYFNITAGKEEILSNDFNKYILYVSRLEPRKNHISLLKAFVELKLYEEYNLIFIGKKTIPVLELDEYLKSLQNDIRKKVLIIDNLNEQELVHMYKNASLFVYPSKSEGFGIPPLEAISAGVRTICSYTTALSDFGFFQDYFFNPDDIDELKEKIVSAMNDATYPIEEFQRIIKSKYDWYKIADNFKEILKNELN
jgi:glycosyltransferase involved in cell wall biosynthesis